MKFFLIDDHPLIRAGVETLLVKDGHEVLYQAGTLVGARTYLRGDWDIAILDLNLPDGDGLELVRELRAIGIKKPILIFSMEVEEASTHRALEAGANGFLHKGFNPSELPLAIERLAAGKRYTSTVFMEGLTDRVYSGGPKTLEDTLSPKEKDVLRLIGKGLSTKEIAEQFQCSANTVATFRHRILKKLKLASSVELIRYALKYR